MDDNNNKCQRWKLFYHPQRHGRERVDYCMTWCGGEGGKGRLFLANVQFIRLLYVVVGGWVCVCVVMDRESEEDITSNEKMLSCSIVESPNNSPKDNNEQRRSSGILCGSLL